MKQSRVLSEKIFLVSVFMHFDRGYACARPRCVHTIAIHYEDLFAGLVTEVDDDFLSRTACFLKSFPLSRFPHKSVDLFFIIVVVKDQTIDLWRS